MGKPKLTYFPVAGRAEPIKYMLAIADADYEYKRITKDEWPAIKPKTVMGQLPLFEDEGVEFSQTPSIARYVASKYGFMPATPIEKAQADMFAIHIFTDVFNKFVKAYFPRAMGNEDSALAEYETFAKESKDGFLDIYEKRLASSKSGFLVGDKMTYADIVAAELFYRMEQFDSKALAGHPHVKSLTDKIHNLPKIKKHLETRGYKY